MIFAHCWILVISVFIISVTGLLLYRKTVINSFPSLLKERDGVLIANGSAAALCDVAILFSLYLYWHRDYTASVLFLYMLPVIIFSLIGWFDDLTEFRIKTKLIAQLLVAGLSVFLISTFQEVSIAERIVLFALIMWMVNAFNLVDILDGLLPSLSILLLIGLCLIFPESQHIEFIACWIAALLSLFALNVFRPYVFSGDAGAHLFGVLTTLFLFNNYLLLKDDFKASLTKVVILFSLLIFDFFFVVFLRIIRKKSPFHKSDDHLALIIMKKSKSRVLTLIIFVLIQISLILIII